MASFVNVSPPPPNSRSPATFSYYFPSVYPSVIRFKSWPPPRLLVFRVRCSFNSFGDARAEETQTKHSLSGDVSHASTSTYWWCVGLGCLGFLESTYLTFLKVTNSDAFCPIGGGDCGDVLNSVYASLFGVVPLPLIGMASYGLVSILGLQLALSNMSFGINKNDGRTLLLWSTTSMTTASAFFLYILSAKFSGVSCSYCLLSALLSLCLFFISIKDFKLQELQKGAIVQLCIVSLVIGTLSASYKTSQPITASLDEIELQPFTTEITTESSPLALSLARHLHFVGAKMYGAFWCSHCIEQKQMFGREASKILDYVECFPNGYMKGVKMEKACTDVGIEGFPTWVIGEEILNGKQEFAELARASGFNIDDPSIAELAGVSGFNIGDPAIH